MLLSALLCAGAKHGADAAPGLYLSEHAARMPVPVLAPDPGYRHGLENRPAEHFLHGADPVTLQLHLLSRGLCHAWEHACHPSPIWEEVPGFQVTCFTRVTCSSSLAPEVQCVAWDAPALPQRTMPGPFSHLLTLPGTLQRLHLPCQTQAPGVHHAGLLTCRWAQSASGETC